MKILICVDRLTGGGAQRVAALWAQGFVNEGHDVFIVLSNVRTPITYSIPEKVPIFNIDFNIKNGYIRHLCKMLLQTRKLEKIFQKIQPDLVIATGINWGPLIDKARGTMDFDVISTDHYSYERPDSVQPILKRVQRLRFLFNKRFRAVTVLTQADKKFIGDRLNNVYVLPNPLAFEPVNDSNFKRDKTILAVGRFNDPFYKGFDILIEAFGRIKSDFPEWKLQIMGGGNKKEERYLQDLATKNGTLDVLELIPFQADPLPLYRKTGIFCLSSRYEGFGMVLIEAMSQGCACVACDYKGRQKEIIPSEEYGLICEAGNVESLANALRRMISDEDYRHQVEKNAPERAGFYSLENIMQRWDEIFKQSGIKK